MYKVPELVHVFLILHIWRTLKNLSSLREPILTWHVGHLIGRLHLESLYIIHHLKAWWCHLASISIRQIYCDIGPQDYTCKLHVIETSYKVASLLIWVKENVLCKLYSHVCKLYNFYSHVCKLYKDASVM